MLGLLLPLAAALSCILVPPPPAWPQLRGPNGRGVSEETGLPVRWTAIENIRWRADLPGRGLSAPVIARGRVYVTASSGYQQNRLHVLCLDERTGKQLWERQFAATGSTHCHPKTCMAAPTPVTDGDRVFALFATGDLVCLDADGNLLWYRALVQDYPHVTNQVGLAASPILWRDVLILPLDNVEDSFAAGLDSSTGSNRWKVPRPRDITWTTPLLLTRNGQPEVLFESARELTAYDPATGSVRWSYSGPGTCSIPSPIWAGELIVLSGGAAVLPGTPEATARVAWKAPKLRPAYATPLFLDGWVYAVNNTANVFNCFEAKGGKVVWQQRVKGSFSASPVAGDGKIYLVNEEGTTTVFRAWDQPEILAENRLGEEILATPAIARGALFLRSDKHLFCIAERKGD